LLDLLTERALPVVANDDGRQAESHVATPAVHRLRSSTATRDWVDVEA